ncbi:DUF6438 domain-containing protein [Hymenobacter canadensis]|uniref:DUF6438 domain-containing protein n=1 Tax=Hymenobacter canadensis TaxID=2999067 RepID=A0ABY7LIE4_9BACT|nr:DUF6438 domain-containing protein [Hymenobacter canadensis]WBA40123.1 DUF6438 domain-containing protein [Hymenobacter canadensis]
MRHLLTLLLAASLCGCAAQAQQAPKPAKKATAAKKPKKQKLKASAPVEAAPAIIFSRTPCLGSCPHYTAAIYPDGRVQYEGFQHAPLEGKREFKISVSTVNTILFQAREMNFAKLPATYSDGATDLPATSLSIRQAEGPATAVSVESGAPAELTNLLRYVEKQITDGLGVTADQ